MNARAFTRILLTISAGFRLAAGSTPADPATHAKVIAEYLRMPLTFEINEGQSDPQVKALARGARYGLFLTSTESVFVLAPGKSGVVVRVRTVGANPAARVSGMDRLDSTSNYFVGSDKSKWRQNVSNYARVKYESIYPGIDLVYYGNQQQLEYDYVVAPGADPKSIRLAVEGARKLRVDGNGDLLLETAGGSMRHHKPVIYQKINGARRGIAGNFVLRGNEVAFELGHYDHSKELVIDPSLTFLTYLGGSGTDVGDGLAITTDSGVTIVAGSTSSANFPAADSLYSYTGETDGFVTVFNPTGTKVAQSTYVGGASGVNTVNAIAIDNGELPQVLYIGGITTSRELAVQDAAQSKYGGAGDAWLAQLNLQITITSLNPLEYTLTTTVGFCTYLGGSGTDQITGVAMDQVSKDVFVTGYTTSTNFPVTSGVVQSALAGTEDAFVARYASGIAPETTPAGTLLFSTYLGGTGTTVGKGIAIYTNLGNGNITAYIAGSTTSSALPAAKSSSDKPASAATTTDSEGFLFAISGNGATSPFSDLIGSATTATVAAAVTTDSNGTIYITGSTNDSTLPTVNPVQSEYAGGGEDAFVGAYNSSGTPTFFSYYGGPGYEKADAIGVSLITTDGVTTINIFIAGFTTGRLPAQVNAVQNTYGGGETDGFVTMFSSISGEAYGIGYATYLGGSGTDIIYGLAVGTSGNARLTGLTSSTNMPVTSGAYQTTNAGGYDAFVAEITTTP
jgi:Beta-propeller repeat